MRTASNPTRGYLPWQLSVTFDYNISLHVYILTFILTHQQYCHFWQFLITLLYIFFHFYSGVVTYLNTVTSLHHLICTK